MIVNRIKAIYAKLKISILNKINNTLTNNQRQVLITSLKSVGNNCMFQMPIYVSGTETVEIGDDVSIAAYVHMWGEGGITIGNRVMIASHTTITSLTHDYNQANMYKSLIKNRVKIEDDVWIGSHCTILLGISIGKGAVVGAGSVVTKDVEPYSIVFGCPAKHYKFRKINGQ